VLTREPIIYRVKYSGRRSSTIHERSQKADSSSISSKRKPQMKFIDCTAMRNYIG
jgi:hypothetical protein